MVFVKCLISVYANSMSQVKYPRPSARINPEALSKAVPVRIPLPDLELITVAAEREGLTVSAFIRQSAKATATAEREVIARILTAGSALPNPNQQAFPDLELDDENNFPDTPRMVIPATK